MSRSIAVSVVVTALMSAPVVAQDPAPEKLLSPASQLYVRWDGVAAHADTYKKSFWGPLMAGPSGDSVRALIAKVPKLLGNTLLAEPLLDGKPPAELKATLGDIKNVAKVIDLITDTGVVVGAEVREPAPTLKALGAAFRGVFGGKPPGAELLTPDVQVLVVLPGAADRVEVVNSTLRLLWQAFDYTVEPFAAVDRKGFRIVSGSGSPPQIGRNARASVVERDEPKPEIELQSAWWAEGKHVVVYLGTMRPEKVVAEVVANAGKGGVTGHPLFARCTAKPAFTSVIRGFVDAGRLVSFAKSLAGPFVPGLNTRLDDLGFGNLKAVVFNTGFDGRESRAVWEIDLPGERKGFAKILKRDPIGLADLPPMPPDVRSFLAARIDATALYESGLALAEALNPSDPDAENGRAANTPEAIRTRRGELAKEFDKLLGVSVPDDLLPCLGDKVVVYQSPNEGLSVFGMVVCVSLKDAAKARAAADRLHGGIENVLGIPVKVKKKTLRGVEIRELYSRAFGFITPTYGIVGDWLVVSVHPQGVQGFVLRTTGDLPAWKPDAATAARLAKMPKGGCALQYCDPTATVKNLCTVGPLVLGVFGVRDSVAGSNDNDLDPLDVGLIPNAHELSKHLFPNLTVTADDGKTVRVEVNESLSLPLEVLGLEPLIFGTAVFGFRAF